MKRWTRAFCVAVVTMLVNGCAARVPAPHASPSPQPPASLSDYMAKIRHLSARPLVKTANADMVESRDPALVRQLAELARAPTAAAHRGVAQRYRELGMLDAAYRHFTVAATRDPADAAAFDGLARVWRDWGLPQLGLGDAHRAVFHAPGSAAARNTLGTILQAMGLTADAWDAYAYSARLDTHAGYAVNNLCYLQFREGAFDRAIATCRSAMAIDPGLRAARNNMALALAGAGQADASRAILREAPDPGHGEYNVGILHMAGREYAEATAAFDAASRAAPRLHAARTRAAQARAHADRAARSLEGTQ